MANLKSLKVFPVAGVAWSRTFAALMQMPVLFAGLAVAVCAVNVFYLAMVHDGIANYTGVNSLIWLIAGMLLDLLVLAVLASFLALIILRWELLGEKPSRENVPGKSGRFLRIALLSAILSLIYAVPNVITVIAAGSDIIRFTLPYGLSVAAIFFGYAISILFFLVCMPLYAALAVDSSAASFSNAVADTGRGVGRIFLVWLVVSLPVWLMQIAVSWALAKAVVTLRPDIVFSMTQSIFFLVWVTAMAIAAAYIFKCYGQNLAGNAAGTLKAA